jgi:ABC-type amino acid transport substrate-binding protein
MIVKKPLIYSIFILLLATTWVAQASDLPEIKEEGSIKVAVYKDFPPYSYGTVGKPTGIDVEIAQMIAAKLGLKPLIRMIGADENMGDDLRNNIWKGHYLGGGVADIMLHAPYDREYAEEEDMVKFLSPYYLETLVFAIDTKKLGKEPTIASFGYEKIGVEIDTLSDFYLLSAVAGRIRPNVQHYLSMTKALDALKAGEVSAVMGPRGELEGGLRDAPDNIMITRLVTPGLSRSTWAVGMAVKQGRPQLAAAVDQAMAELYRQGEIEKIFKSYGVNYVAPATP